MNNLKISISLSLIFLMVVASAQASKAKMQKTPSGMEYRLVVNNKGPRVAGGDLVFFKFKGIVSDTLLFDSYKNAQTPYMNFALQENFPKANFEEGLTLMGKGDSAIFLVNTDSFFKIYTGSPAPHFVKAGDKLCFYVLLDSFVAKKELMVRKAKQEEELKSKQENELIDIANYIKATGLNFTKTPSGMHYIITKEVKTGMKAETGDKVGAIYTGKLLDGKVFDSNKSNGNPFEFTLGARQVIAGWDEIFSILKEGEHATIILPSSLGYGANGAGGLIQPYTPLVFDVEFIKITSANPVVPQPK